MMRKAIYVGLTVLAVGHLVAAEGHAAVTTNVKVPVNLLVGIPCSGDLVQASGNLHILLAQTVTPSGNFMNKFHFQPQGVKGVVVLGPNLGAKYTGTGVTQATFTSSSNSFETTFISRFDFHGQGKAPNLKIHMTTHVTFANGQLRAQVLKTRITCK